MAKPMEISVKREQLVWTTPMDVEFIQAMLTQQEKGNRVGGTFTSQAYANMVEELTTKLKMPFTKSHLKNRLKTLKANFAQCYDIFRGASLSGFAWNPVTRLIEAENEVWEALIAEKPLAAKWKTTQICNYNELLELFAKDRASGAGAETAKEKNAQWKNKDDIKIETISDVDELVATNEVTLENFSTDDEVQEVSPMAFSSKQPSNATKSKSKKRKLEEEVVFNTKIMSSVHEVAGAIREGNTVLQQTNMILERAYQHEYTGDEIYKELEPMGLEPDLIAVALIFLAENPKKARLLFGIPISLRMNVLTKMMGGTD